jgi:hypothetical protein
LEKLFNSLKLSLQQSYIKVPEGLPKICRNRGIYTSVLFWYKMKSIKQTGLFSKENLVLEIQKNFNISKSTIYSHISILKKLHFIRESYTHYSLISYDKLFALLGYDLSLKRLKKGYRKGNFAIDKIDTSFDIENLKERIDCGELKLNLRRQFHIVNSSMSPIKEALVYKESENSITYNGLNIKLRLNKVETADNNINISIRDNFVIKDNEKTINLIQGISSKGIAKILGLRSTKSVHDLKIKSINKQLIHIYHQNIILKEYCDFLDEAMLHQLLMKRSYNFRGGSFNKPLTYQLQDTFCFYF